MQADTRRLQPVKIGMTSVETGRDRFTRNEHLSLPRASNWRNNLTALSQRYNLYFVAVETSIRVYQPRFPFQTLGEKPSLTIPPTLAEPKARGYIDTRQHHTINHIIVGDLGTEEILLVATDSGNIAAYHTKAIRDAIGKDPYKYSTDARSDVVGVRAFFSHWVHESAWGLAIHKEARMIAVSANTARTPSQDDQAKITVFAFALTWQDHADDRATEDDSSEPPKQLEWMEWVPNPYIPWLSDRSHNYKTVLSGHSHNIPSISFVNSKHDRDGSWLLSTDIRGQMKLWHIWIRHCDKSWPFSTPQTSGTALEGVFERGWLVLALDPASFRKADSLEELCGTPRPLKYLRYTGPGESYDITNWVRKRVPNTSQLHPAFGTVDDDPEERDESDLEPLEMYWSDDEAANPEAGGAYLNVHHEDSSSGDGEERVEDRNVQTEEPVQPPEEDDDHLTEGLLPHEADQALNVIHIIQDSPHLETLHSPSDEELDQFHQNSFAEEGTSMVSEAEEGQSSSDWATVAQANVEDRFPESVDMEHITYLGPPRKKPRHSESYKKVYEAFMAAKAIRASPRLQSISMLPVIQCSASHIRLINVPEAKSPHFFCASALKQTLPGNLERSPLIDIDRLNMAQYIPDLGITIIATQIGRCAVCTLTRKSDTGTPGFRVDWILPTKEQERQGLRPNAPLLGVAAGPIQGRQLGEEDSSSDDNDSTFNALNSLSSSSSSESSVSSEGDLHDAHQKSRPRKRPRPPQIRLKSYPLPKAESWHGIEESRRYRLMLTYYDQTVLTYELSREAPSIGIDGRKNWRNRPSGMV